jgi:predicted DNA-binding transcriptional regulator AlpA
MLTLKDIAADLKVSLRQVYRLTSKQSFPPAVKIGELRRWMPKEYEEWKERQPRER